MRRICTLAVAAVLSASSLLAADLGKYKDWNDSPSGYFMTRAEREQWSKLGSEADAEQFVQKYAADRGGEPFTKELTKRIAMADKYLTVAETPGSKSLRGKVVILLGPPAGMNVTVKLPPSAGRSGTAATSMSAAGESSGTSSSDMGKMAEREGMSGGDIGLRDYNFSYGAATLPTKKDAVLVVEVNTRNGKDRIADKKAAAELEQLFESAARASITAAK
jgi:GWxTD domain-containing protein